MNGLLIFLYVLSIVGSFVISYILWRKVFMEQITSTYPITIQILQHGDAQILNVVYPAGVYSGESFIIEYDCINNGGEDLVFGRIKNDTSGEVIEGTAWEQSIPSGETIHHVDELPGITEPLTATIEVGYNNE